MEIYVYGVDLNNGRGFESFKDARMTLDYNKLPWGSKWNINSKIYELTNVFNKPFYNEVENEK